MARKITSEEYREHAKKLQEKAKKKKEQEDMKLGRYIRAIAEKDFPMTYDELKQEIRKIIKS